MLTPQQIKEIEEEFDEKFEEVILCEEDRVVSVGIKSFITTTTINNILAERDKEIAERIDDEYKRGDVPVIASGRCRYAKMTETIGESRARQSGWLSGLLTVRDKILNIK